MSVYEIPLAPTPQQLSVLFPSGTVYVFRLIFQFTPNPCWLLDINDANDNPLVLGIPLVTGADLLAQYGYLGFGCAMYCYTDGDLGAVPTLANLGVTSHLCLDDSFST